MPTPQEEFEQVRWKMADNMDDHDVEVILANKDQLNEEERAAFANILTTSEPLPENPLDAAINNAVDATPNPTVPVITPDPVAPVVPATPVALTTPTAPVIQQDQLDTYLEAKKKEWDAQGKTAAEQKQEEAKITNLFEQGYAPKDWNDFGVQYLEKITPLIEQRVLAKLDAQNQERAKQQDILKEESKKVYARFEQEFKTLAESKMIPDPVTDKENYDKVHQQIVAIGDAHGKTNITDAYKLWSIIPVEHGGGLVTGAPVAPTDPNAKINAQKAAAGKIGGGGGTASPQKKAPDWHTLHSMSMDDLLERRLQES